MDENTNKKIDYVAKIEDELLNRISYEFTKKTEFAEGSKERIQHEAVEEALNKFLDWIKYIM